MEPFVDIQAERNRQNRKWGKQKYAWTEWISILTEEVGEAAQEANKAHWGKSKKHIRLLREELIQVAAVAVAIIESIDEETVDNQPRICSTCKHCDMSIGESTCNNCWFDNNKPNYQSKEQGDF